MGKLAMRIVDTGAAVAIIAALSPLLLIGALWRGYRRLELAAVYGGDADKRDLEEYRDPL